MKYFTRLKHAAVMLAIAFVTVLAAGSAFAAGEYTINIAPTVQTFIELGFVALSAVVAWLVGGLVSMLRQKTGIQIDDSMRFYIDQAILNGLRFAREKALDGGGSIHNPAVKNQMVALAAAYALDKVPDALKHFGLDDEDRLKELVVARLPEIAA